MNGFHRYAQVFGPRLREHYQTLAEEVGGRYFRAAGWVLIGLGMSLGSGKFDERLARARVPTIGSVNAPYSSSAHWSVVVPSGTST